MSFSSKDFISNSKYSVSIVEIVDRFWSKVLFNINWVPFFKLDIKWIFGNICWKSVEECTTIISCVASYIGTYLSYVLRKCGKKENGPVFKVVIEKLIRSHTDCKQGLLPPPSHLLLILGIFLQAQAIPLSYQSDYRSHPL